MFITIIILNIIQHHVIYLKQRLFQIKDGTWIMSRGFEIARNLYLTILL
jgi:hypothetical protein